MAVFDILARLKIDKGDAESAFTAVEQKGVLSINQLNEKLKEQRTLRDAANDTATIKKMNAEMEQTQKQLDGLTGQSQGFFASMKSGAGAGIALGAGMAVFDGFKSVLSGVTGAANDFDQSLHNIGSLGVKNFNEIGDSLLDLSKTIPKDAGDLANATYQAISSGIDPTKVIGFVEQSAKVAVAGQATTEQAVDTLTSVLNAYKLKTEDTAKVSDVLFSAINYGKTTFKELNGALANVVPVAASVNVGIDQVSAAVAQMTSLGVPTAQASTQIRAALVELQKPGAELTAIMKAAGTSVDDLKNPSIGLNGVLQKVSDEATRQGKSLTQVFSSVEAGSAALLLAGDNAESANKQLANVRNGAGAATDAYNVLKESNVNLFQVGKNYLNSYLIPVAQKLGSLAGSVGPAVGGFAQLASVLPLAAAGTKIMSLAQGALNLVMDANPITLTVIAIVALGAAMVAAYHYITPVHDAIDSVWNVLKATGAFIGAFVTNEIGALAQGFSGVGKVIDGIIHLDMGKVKEGAGDVAGAVGKHFSGAAAGTAAFSKSIHDSEAALKTTGATGKDAGEKTTLSFGNATAAIKETKVSVDSLGSAFEAEIKGSKEAAEKAISNIAALTKERRTASQERRAEIDDELKQQQSAAADNAKTFKVDSAIRQSTEDRYFGAKKGQAADLLALAKAEADSAAQGLQVRLEEQAAVQGRALTTREELAIEQLRGDVLNQSLVKLKAFTAQSGKFALKANVEVEQQNLKQVKLEGKINIDNNKVASDLQDALDEQFKKEIDLGIRPKSDTLVLFQRMRDRIQDEMDQLTANLGDPVAIEKLRERIMDIDKESADFRTTQEKELADFRIGLMDDGFAKEKASLDQKFAENLKLYKDDAETRKAIEDRHGKDVLALQKKYGLAGVDIAKTATDALSDLYRGLIAERQQLDEADVQDKRRGYDEERTALEGSRQRGELDAKAYNAKLGKLTADRTKFEAEVTEQSKSRIAVAIDGSLVHAQDAFAKEAETFIFNQIKMALGMEIAEADKTAAAEVGWVARQVIIGAEIVAKTAATAATLLWAEAEVVLGWVIANPIAGVAIGLGVAAAMVAGIKAIGFADGGLMGIVGERGAEIVGPATDFSQLVSQLVTQTAAATERSLDKRQGVKGQNGRLDVRFGGEAKVRGRDLNLVGKREELSSQRERLVTT